MFIPEMPIHVATVLTACGIETFFVGYVNLIILKLQQYLPLAVLKHDFTSYTYKYI